MIESGIRDKIWAKYKLTNREVENVNFSILIIILVSNPGLPWRWPGCPGNRKCCWNICCSRLCHSSDIDLLYFGSVFKVIREAFKKKKLRNIWKIPYVVDYLLFSKSQYQKLFLAIFDVDWCHKQGIIFTFVRN